MTSVWALLANRDPLVLDNERMTTAEASPRLYVCCLIPTKPYLREQTSTALEPGCSSHAIPACGPPKP